MSGPGATNITDPKKDSVKIEHNHTTKSFLGSAGLVFRATGNRCQLMCVLLFPLAMSLVSLVRPHAGVTAFDFWLMVPALAISIAFFNTVFLTSLEDREKVKARWKKRRELIAARANRKGYDLNPPMPAAFRTRVTIWVMLFFVLACVLPCAGVDSPLFTFTILPTMLIAAIWFGRRITGPGGSIESLQLHVPKMLRR